MRSWNSFIVAAVMAVAAFACGSSPAPNKQLADSTAAVRAAQEVGAEDQPRASLYLKMARDEVAQADQLMKDDHNGDAKLVLERAAVDAELSLALAREAGSRADAEQTRRDISDMKARMQ